jgi:hypothetical protein
MVTPLSREEGLFRRRAGRSIRASDAGNATIVVVAVLLLLVGLFVFGAIVGGGGGLSAEGGFPRDPAERRRLLNEWTKPSPVKAADLEWGPGCTLKAGTLHIENECVLRVGAAGPPPRSALERIRAAFGPGPRRLTVTPLKDVALTLTQKDDGDPPADSPAMTAHLGKGRATDFSIPRAGAKLELTCSGDCLSLPDLAVPGR